MVVREWLDITTYDDDWEMTKIYMEAHTGRVRRVSMKNEQLRSRGERGEVCYGNRGG